MWPKTSPVWDQITDSGEFNLDKARQQLVEAGYPNGFETSVITSGSSFPPLMKLQQIYQADLVKLGIQLDIQDMESNQFRAAISQPRWPGLMAHVNPGPQDQDPAFPFTTGNFRPGGNGSRFTSPTYTALVDAALKEPDWNQRVSMYRQLAQLVKEEAFVLPITDYTALVGLANNVQGCGVVPPTQILYENIWLS